MGTQQYSLRWNNYLRHITCAFETLRTDKDLVDVTLSCDGKKIHAHKMLLSACSSYFRDLFKENPCKHPVIIFRNVFFDDLVALINFMYQGEVNVQQEQLASFLNTAELLQVQGLTNNEENTCNNDAKNTREDIDLPPPEVHFGSANSPSISPAPSSTAEPILPINVSKSTTSASLSSSASRNKRRRLRGRSISPGGETKSAFPVISSKEVLEMQQKERSLSPPIEIQPMKLESICASEDVEQWESIQEDEPLPRLRSSNQQHSLHNKNSLLSDEHKMDQAYENHDIDNISTINSGDSVHKPGPSNDRQPNDSLQGMTSYQAYHSRPLTMVHPPTSISGVTVGIQFAPYACKLCGVEFRNRESWNLHRSSHEGRATCPLCSKELRNKKLLKKHLDKVHNISE